MFDPLEIPRPETKTPGNPILFSVGHPWKFHFVLMEPLDLEIPHAISYIPLEILCPQPPCLPAPLPLLFFFFSGIAQYHL